MSKKLGILGNHLTMIDSVTDVLEFSCPAQLASFVHVESLLSFILDPMELGAKQEAKQYLYADVTDVNGDAFANAAAIRTFLYGNTGDSNTQVGLNKSVVLVTDDKTLVWGDSDIEQNIATDAKVFTLPLITTEILGKSFLFRNVGADGNNIVTISPASADAVHGTVANAAADSVAGGVVDKDIINTKATANKADYIVLTPVALTEWNITGGVGIWASEA